ncbi:hypothetical protein PFDSM3638_00620 [Pyrococcus furiosus DSM 3638]|uniref:Uncharacterized protein n=3 Tax=Pyrococcus furiosus TaxID=2261 RepID=Q8U4F2_PYRFU|nr:MULTISPECIES: hypothetical protein [Pyrococcus]AAL80260.1 hypothetical protein PF0136 [Pyrococcus furiosus DSM 3638]AFN04440.1 hypothetical protein PFC_07520 [Pyrococcus furiosus COM1]MDK2870597.1 hypothetical protein [Pyrococcus sp.]QEK77866.1 hypothetical protein PFDSM3638_00620 [Pyrococcus furiosus DSM 3638]
MLNVAGIGVEIRGDLDDGFEDAFLSTFSKRYLPDVSMRKSTVNVVIKRRKGKSFRVFGALYDNHGVDEYIIESPPPKAYENESPVFFLLQAVARAGAKLGKIFLTDSASILKDNEGILFLGYPHSGKSTLSSLALAEGFPVLSTENTVVEVRNGKLYITGGTSVLVYDPVIEEIYGVKLPYDEVTRSGYRIKSVEDPKRAEILGKGVKVSLIVVLHSAFNCKGFSFSEVKGRKVRKTLWYFATSLVKGVDYYEPRPLDLPITPEIWEELENFLNAAGSVRIIEAFGNHREILLGIINDEV